MKDSNGALLWIVIPFAAVGAFALIDRGGFLGFIGKFFLLGMGAVVVVVVAIVALVLYLVFGSSKKKQAEQRTSSSGTTSTSARKGKAEKQEKKAYIPVDRTNPEEKAVLNKGEQNLSELNRMLERIQNTNIRMAGIQVCRQAEKILLTLREKPEEIPSVRQFLNYYLPTLGEILVKYERMEQGEVVTLDMTQHVLKYLEDIRLAMEKQYKNLFEDDILDMTVEMEAMTMACRRDGLLNGQEMTENDREDRIDLTL